MLSIQKLNFSRKILKYKMKIKSINPYTEEINEEYDLMSMEQVNEEFKSVRIAFTQWSRTDIHKRLKLIKKAAETLRKNTKKYAEIMTKEMGKPIKESTAEVEKCAWLCDYYAENAENMLKPEHISTEAKKSYVVFEPMGIVFAIMPWNFPFWQVFRCAIPSLAAGNACVLKHASNVPMSALAIEEVFTVSGFPINLFKTLLIDSKTAMQIIDEDKVDAVSLTGSNHAGSQVAALAGKNIRKVVLELGGSDPFIVLEDADIKKAAKTATQSRMLNAGQSCIAAKRFIVMKSVSDEFIKELSQNIKVLKMGDPMDASTDIGPMARKEFQTDLEKQLEDAKKRGAKILQNDNIPPRGFFFAPSVVSNAPRKSKVLSEEVFGPIAPVIIINNEEELIKVANDTEFGLGASIWSKNTERAEKLATHIQAGCIAINTMVKSDPRLPFGGVKKSGIGRELSHYGLKEFVNIKTVVVEE